MDVQRDLEYMYGWNYYTMKFMGIWPEERRWSQPSSYRVLIPVLMMLCFICAAQTANIPRICNDFYLIVENLSMGNITITISLVKTIVFWINGKQLKSLLKCIAEDWSKKISIGHRIKMVNVARITRITIIRSTLMCNAVVVIYSLLRIFTFKYSGTRLLFRAYFPYNIDTSPNYELTVCGQIIGAFYAAMSYTAVDTFVAMLVFHVCGQLSILSDEIKELPTCDKTDIRVKLAGVVQKFEYLKKFTETIENCFNLMLLLQMIACSVQLCFQCFQAIVSIGDEINEFVIFQLTFLLLYVIYVLLQLYLYCYVGNKLLDESTNLANAAYNCKWYNLSAKNAKLLVIVIRRARLPFRITAGKFCTLTLVLYSDILKRSMGYISVLYAIKSKPTFDTELNI